MCQKENPEPQPSIWSVPGGKLRWYITLLLTTGSALCGYLIKGELGNPAHGTDQELVKAILTDIVLSYTAAAIGSFVAIRGGDLLMVIAHFIRERTRKRHDQTLEQGRTEGRAEGRAEGQAEGRAEGQAEGRAEGRAENQAEWLDWNRRRMAAESAGRQFEEPYPTSDDAD